ncbi:transmembrane protein 130 isoform X2 [Stegostoma tigrinum]|uniref:transmembrane protein 130 isoform X2 n=1 Tax=Stegostoma tigrinum TaxID=3053191 RepID=UPI00202ACB04|nr:transmembrane protein 130 isoform X2 [Stegostoma tigrinum]
MTSLELLLLLNTAVLSGMCWQYELLLSNNGPITTGARGTVEARLVPKPGSRQEQLEPQPYTFHWNVESPLAIVRSSEQEFNSSITVRSLAPKLYALRAWVTRTDCSWCPPLAHGSIKLLVTDSVVGTLSLKQPNGSITFSRKEYELATNIPTQISFILYDPSDYFDTASFRYFWYFGDGERMVTNKSYALHIYPTPGTYQLHLDVLAYLNHSQQRTGVYGASLSLLDTIKKIEVMSVDDIHADHKKNFYIYVNGSPPLDVCWLVSRSCIAVIDHSCDLIELPSSTVSNVSYTFRDLGPYTFNVRAKNSVSTLQACYKITTWKNGIHPVWFIVPCVTLFTIILLFVLSIAMRKGSARKDSIEVADFDFSPMSDKSVTEAWAPSRGTVHLCCIPCGRQKHESHSLSRREAHSLLKFSHTQIQAYSQRPEICSSSPL